MEPSQISVGEVFVYTFHSEVLIFVTLLSRVCSFHVDDENIIMGCPNLVQGDSK